MSMIRKTPIEMNIKIMRIPCPPKGFAGGHLAIKNKFFSDEMSMFNETPTGMINLHMRIPCVSKNKPYKRINLNT